MNRSSSHAVIWLISCLQFAAVVSANEFEEIVPGHWLEVRGGLDEKGVFQAQRVNLIEPESEEVLIGTITETDGTEQITLLGQMAQISEKTRFNKVTAGQLANLRVKVEGHYRGPKRFSIRKITTRGPGRERVSGPVSEIRKIDNGYSFRIMNFEVMVPGDADFRHEKPVDQYAVVSMNLAVPAGKQLSEDDQFGEGWSMGQRLRFTTLLEARYKTEYNYNLSDPRDEDLEDSAVSIRGRFVLSPGNYGMSGQFEFRHTQLRRNEESLGTVSIDDTRIGESFVIWDDPFDIDFDIQAGRMDFDDRREWIYDQNLDGVRIYWRVSQWLAELSATTTLSDGKLRDENTNNFVAYFSDFERRFAAYAIYRDTDSPVEESVLHVGARAFVDWPPRHESWFEVSRMSGSRGETDLHGWGFDLGTTRKIGERWFLTASWAWGQGDENNRDGSDGNFRQTRLQDNNGKFAGVTSFRYYGEMVDPELANMHIGTLGIGFRASSEISFDLVGHYYRQDKAVRRIIDSDIDQKPNGIDHELGLEIDAIVGWRPVRAWDFELVLGRFKPGKAFLIDDDAWVGKLQLRYRY